MSAPAFHKNTSLCFTPEYSAKTGRFLAPFACHPELSRGLLHNEPHSKHRSAFQRDRDRIIHSTAFRRLEYKTQVFVYHEGDHFRTRLTHSLEVAQLARACARRLYLDDDLAEAIALAHDLGHTPFGHAGEEALDEMMAPYGGFDHNAQTIRILTELERKYADFNGLNLSWECLEGLAKHNGPLQSEGEEIPLPRALKTYNNGHDLELHTHASLEAQVAALCDDIAYVSHDIEDGLRAGLFTEEDLLELPFVGNIFSKILDAGNPVDSSIIHHESKRRMIDHMVQDLVDQTLVNLRELGAISVDDIRSCGHMMVHFSSTMREEHQIVKTFLYDRMYRHYKVNRMTSKARRLVRELFTFYHGEPDCLPTQWRKQVEHTPSEEGAAIIVADFIAGMTDRFAMMEYRRIFDPSYQLIGG